MEITETSLPGVIEITPPRFGDDRGWFSETWSARRMADAGIDLTWVQDNESVSAEVGTVRGLHFQTEPSAQDKLVRVIHGRILDVAVDLRRSSPTFGEWVGVELTADAGNQLFVPRGFGHGFATLEPNCRVAYKVTDFYAKDCERVVAWNDPALGIDWKIGPATAVLADRDATAPLLADAPDLFA